MAAHESRLVLQLMGESCRKFNAGMLSVLAKHSMFISVYVGIGWIPCLSSFRWNSNGYWTRFLLIFNFRIPFLDAKDCLKIFNIRSLSISLCTLPCACICILAFFKSEKSLNSDLSKPEILFYGERTTFARRL